MPSPQSALGDRDPSAILIADVVAIYGEDVVRKHARPKETAARLESILDFFGDKYLSYLNKITCAAYVKHRGGKASHAENLKTFAQPSGITGKRVFVVR